MLLTERKNQPYTKESRYRFVRDGNEIFEVHSIKVHEFLIEDTINPDLRAGDFLYNFQESEIGQWILQNSYYPPTWHKVERPHWILSYTYTVVAYLPTKKLSEYYLRFDPKDIQNIN
jgi:hypothetical protein